MLRTEKVNYLDCLKALTKIVGKPTFTTLKTLEQEVCCNAPGEASTEGGGAYGHLFLVLQPDTFEALENADPYICLPHPGTLQIGPNATAAQATAQ